MVISIFCLYISNVWLLGVIFCVLVLAILIFLNNIGLEIANYIFALFILNWFIKLNY